MIQQQIPDIDDKELPKIGQAAEKVYGKAATKTATKKAPKTVKKAEPYELPITAIRGSFKKAASKLGEDEIPDFEIKKPARARSVPAAPPVSTTQIAKYLAQGLRKRQR